MVSEAVEYVAGKAAVALGHHWFGEEHLLLALAGDAGAGVLDVDAGALEAALRARVARDGPPVAKEHEGCSSATSYHSAIGRAHGLALSRGLDRSRPADLLVAVLWDPDGLAAGLLRDIGTVPEAVLDAPSGAGHTVAVTTPGADNLARAASLEATAMGLARFGAEHVLLSLLGGDPGDGDDPVARALRICGLDRPALAAAVGEMWAEVPRADSVSDPAPNPRARELLGRAEGLAGARGAHGVGPDHALAAYLWGDGGGAVLELEAFGTTATALLAALAAEGVEMPPVPLHEPDRTPWDDPVDVPIGRLDEVLARLNADLRAGSWGFNYQDELTAWVGAHAHLGLAALVADVLSGPSPPEPEPGH